MANTDWLNYILAYPPLQPKIRDESTVSLWLQVYSFQSPDCVNWVPMRLEIQFKLSFDLEKVTLVHKFNLCWRHALTTALNCSAALWWRVKNDANMDGLL